MRSTPTASSTPCCSNAAQPRSESIPVVSFTTGTEAYGRGVGRYSSALAQALCDAAGVADGDAALDVGCGPGALVSELARRLGAHRVAGIDPSAPFVAVARLR